MRLIVGPDGELTWLWRTLETAFLDQVVELLNETEMTGREIADELGITYSKFFRLKQKAEAKRLLRTKEPEGKRGKKERTRG